MSIQPTGGQTTGITDLCPQEGRGSAKAKNLSKLMMSTAKVLRQISEAWGNGIKVSISFPDVGGINHVATAQRNQKAPSGGEKAASGSETASFDVERAIELVRNSQTSPLDQESVSAEQLETEGRALAESAVEAPSEGVEEGKGEVPVDQGRVCTEQLEEGSLAEADVETPSEGIEKYRGETLVDQESACAEQLETEERALAAAETETISKGVEEGKGEVPVDQGRVCTEQLEEGSLAEADVETPSEVAFSSACVDKDQEKAFIAQQIEAEGGRSGGKRKAKKVKGPSKKSSSKRLSSKKPFLKKVKHERCKNFKGNMKHQKHKQHKNLHEK